MSYERAMQQAPGFQYEDQIPRLESHRMLHTVTCALRSPSLVALYIGHFNFCGAGAA